MIKKRTVIYLFAMATCTLLSPELAVAKNYGCVNIINGTSSAILTAEFSAFGYTSQCSGEKVLHPSTNFFQLTNFPATNPCYFSPIAPGVSIKVYDEKGNLVCQETGGDVDDVNQLTVFDTNPPNERPSYYCHFTQQSDKKLA